MTKIMFRNKIYNTVDEVMKENNYDTYSIRKYRKEFNLSSYEILKKIQDGTIDENKFINKETTKLGLKRKENLSYLVLKSTKPFIVNGIKYNDIIQAINKEDINYKTLLKKFSNQKTQDTDTLIKIFSDLMNNKFEKTN